MPENRRRPSGVSMIIPVHRGRSGLQPRLLQSLVRAAGRLTEPWEIIVVDDSPEPEAELVARHCSAHGARYARGPAEAGRKRNLGARLARFDVLVFMDSDCSAGEALLAEHLTALRNSGAEVAGVAGPTMMHGRRTLAWQVADRSREYNQCYVWPLVYEELTWCTTSNLALRAEAFERVGGFDEATFTPVGGEDVDLGVRLVGCGYKLKSNPRATAYHTREHIRHLHQIASALFVHGRADVYLTWRYRDRTLLWLNPWASFTVAALAGVVGWRVSGRRTMLVAGPLALAAALGKMAAMRLVPALSAPGRGGRGPYPLGTGVDALQQAHPRGDTLPERAKLVALDLLCVLLDSAHDAGVVWEAIRRGLPVALFRRYRYLDDGFLPYGAQDADDPLVAARGASR